MTGRKRRKQCYHFISICSSRLKKKQKKTNAMYISKRKNWTQLLWQTVAPKFTQLLWNFVNGCGDDYYFYNSVNRPLCEKSGDESVTVFATEATIWRWRFSWLGFVNDDATMLWVLLQLMDFHRYGLAIGQL